MTGYTALDIRPIAVPASLDAADAAPFRRLVELGNAVCRYDAGHDYLDQDATEALGFWQATDDWTNVGYSAWRGDHMVGAGTMTIATQPGTTNVDYEVIVDPELWGEGIEEALLAEVEREAKSRGMRTLQTWTLHRPDTGGEQLTPTTGWGSVPAGDRQTVFQLKHGFSLEQVERNSSFNLRGPLDQVERMLADALRVAGDDYRVVQWTGATPEHYLDSFAYTISRMSTDAPQGGLDVEEQIWDADRVRRRDARLRAQGLTVSVTAVEHIPTGAIAAYNELVIGEDQTGATQQFGTLVTADHRGRRLGTVVKCANLLRWRELVPTSPRVSTFNAEENRHMLSINESLGFVPVSYAGAWQKTLSAD
jgi:GNAT superfamily N-acetyltransferase